MTILSNNENRDLRCLDIIFFIDTNRINAKKGESYMNQLEKWRDNGLIRLIIPEAAYKELMDEKSTSIGAIMRKKKALQHIYSMNYIKTEEEKEKYNYIKNVLFPNEVMTKKKRVDVLNVFLAGKDNCPLITNDGGSNRQPGGILGHRTELAKLNIKIMRDIEAVEIVKKVIEKRDKHLRRCYEKDPEKYPLPNWVGKD